MADLKPCPFCGGDRIEIYDLGHQETPCWFVTCNNCGAEISGFWQESGAIEAWNRRAGEEDKHE